jgi:predicted MFS family arabinose efflux permease
VAGIFAVTFSVVFAYVADVTEEHERSWAYGLVSATFAASLVTSPALGAWIELNYSEDLVIAAATAIAILDVFFIMVAVPESLPDNPSASRGLTLEQVDPFSALRKMWKDATVLMLCITVFFSFLPEAGQVSKKLFCYVFRYFITSNMINTDLNRQTMPSGLRHTVPVP